MGSKRSHKMRRSRSNGQGTGASRGRGSGMRGGKGNAGSGKKADCKKFTYMRIPDYYGKHGFGMVAAGKPVCLNVGDINDRINALIAKGTVKSGQEVTLNLTELGYGKLLGGGNIEHKVKITVAVASPGAVEKVKAVGGTVIVE